MSCCIFSKGRRRSEYWAQYKTKTTWQTWCETFQVQRTGELTYGGVSRLSVLTTTGGGLAWGEETQCQRKHLQKIPPQPPTTSNHKTWATSHRAANTTHTEPKLSAVQQIKDSGDIRDLLSSWYYRPTEDKTGSRWIWAEISEDSAVRTWWHFTLQKMQCWSMKPKSIKSSPEGWRLCSFTSSSSSSSFNLKSVPRSLTHSLSVCLDRSLSFCPGGARWALKSHVGEVWHFSHCLYL